MSVSIATVPMARPTVAVTDPHADLDFGDLLALSKELVSTGFLPQHIKTPGQAAAIILTGREMGMGPMRAIRSLQVVKGKVIESADSQLARFKADGGRAVFTSLTETTAVLVLQHPNGDEHTETFTLADAKRAGLDSSDTYRKFPKAMLRSRAITAGLKSVGWEGAVGNYDREEAATSFAPELHVETPTLPPLEPVNGTPDDDSAPLTHARKAAADKVIPFGKLKDRTIGSLTPDENEKLASWCREKDAERASKGEPTKFDSLLEALDEVAGRLVGDAAE